MIPPAQTQTYGELPPRNESKLIELSKAAAKVAGIADFRFINVGDDGKSADILWLHEDNARCFELICRYLISPNQLTCGSVATDFYTGYDGEVEWGEKTYIAEYNNDREQATRVAILKAIVVIGEEK